MDDNKIYKETEQIIKIQAENKATLNTNVTVYSYDKNTAKFLFQLTKNNQPISLGDSAVVKIALKFESANGKAVLGSVIEDEIEGIVSIVIPEEYLGYQGSVTGGIYIDYSNSQSLDCGYFKFSMKRSLIDDELGDMPEYYVEGFENLRVEINDKSEEMKNKLADLDSTFKELDVYNKSQIDDKVDELKPAIDNVTAQLAQTNSLKVDKGGVGQVTWAMADQNFRSQVLGDVPPAVVGTNSVSTTNIVDKSVTNSKKTVSGSSAFIGCVGKPFNINVEGDLLFQNVKLQFPSDAYIFYQNKTFKIYTGAYDFLIPTPGMLFYDVDLNTLKVGLAKTNTESELLLGFIYPSGIFLNGYYTVNGKANIRNNSITKKMLDFEIAENISVDSKWKDKKGVTFGDSITWYDGQPFANSHKNYGETVKGYQSYMKEKLGCTITNKGASGEDLTQITQRIKLYNFSETDFVTLTSGANDARKGIPVGEIGGVGSNFDLSTFIGSLQSGIEYMINSKKDIKIYLMTPIRGWYKYYNTPSVPNTDPNIIGMMPESYANAIKSVGKLYGIPVLDWYNLTGLNELTKTSYLGDLDTTSYYLHPTNPFFKIMASSLIPFLNNY